MRSDVQQLLHVAVYLRMLAITSDGGCFGLASRKTWQHKIQHAAEKR